MQPLTAQTGWHPDPQGRFEERFWDGSRYTNQVADRDRQPVPSGPAPRTRGWASDPTGRYLWRYSDGARWTDWVSFIDAAAEAPAHDLEVVSRFIDELTRDHVITAVTARVLRTEVERRRHPATIVPPPVVAPTPSAPAPAPTAAPAPSPAPTRTMPVPTGVPTAAPAPAQARTIPAPAPAVAPAPSHAPLSAPAPLVPPEPPEPPEPRRLHLVRERSVTPTWRADVAKWWERTRRVVTSDLAIHGLAYLGVGLLFAGVVGFVVFAFGTVSAGLRPLAEVAIPATVLGAGWFLLGRGSRLVPFSLFALGSGLVPIVLVAFLVDGTAPDLTGGALELTLTLSMAALASCYAAIAVRTHNGPMPWMVAPVAWLGVAFASFAFEPGFHGGRAVAHPLATQMAITMAVVLLTAMLARWRSSGRVGAATRQVILPGMFVVGAMALGAVAGHQWPVWPSTVMLLAALGTVEVQRDRMPVALVAPVQAVLLGLSAVAIATDPRVSAGWTAVGAVGAYLALAEWNGRRTPSRLVGAVTLSPLAACLGVALVEPWAAVVAGSAVFLWIAASEHRTAHWLPPRQIRWIALAASVAVLAIGLGRALSTAESVVVLSGAVLAVASAVRVRGDTAVPPWRVGLPVATMLLLGANVVAWVWAADGLLAVGSAVLALTIVVERGSVRARTWLTAATFGWAGYESMVTWGWASGVRVEVLAIAAVSTVVVAELVRRTISAALSQLGALAGVGAVVAAGIVVDRTALTVALGCAALTWCLTAVLYEVGRSAAFADLESALGQLAPSQGAPSTVLAASSVVLAGSAVPAFLVALADRTELTNALSWFATIVVGTGTAEMVVARLFQRRRAAPMLAWWGFALTSATVLTVDQRATEVGLALAIVGPLVLGRRRHILMVGAVWCESLALALVVAFDAGLSTTRWFAVVLGWGAIVSIAGLWTRRALHRRWALPAAFGIIAALVGFTGSFWASPGWTGWCAVGAAVSVAVWSVLLRMPALSTGAWAASLVALGALVPWPMIRHPWSFALVAAALLATSFTVDRPAARRHDVEWVRSWAVGPFVVAHGAAGVALVGATHHGSVDSTLVTVGALALLVGWWRRGLPWVVAGVVLVNGGALAADLGYLSLALLVEAGLVTIVAARSDGARRAALQWLGAAFATGGWLTGLVWTQMSSSAMVAWTAVAGGVATVVPPVLVRWVRVRHDWCTVWDNVGVLAVVASAVGLGFVDLRPAVGGVAVGLAEMAAGAAIAARPLQLPALRHAAAAAALGAQAAAVAQLDLRWIVNVVAVAAMGVVASAVSISWSQRRPGGSWERPVMAFALANSASAPLGAGLTAHADVVRFAWTSATSLVAAVVLVVWAMRSVSPIRAPLQIGAAVATTSAWCFLLLALDVSPSAMVGWSAAVAGMVAAAAVAAARWWRLPKDWCVLWSTLGVMGVAGAAFALAAVELRPAVGGIAVGVAGVAVAVGVAAEPLRQHVLRFVSSGLLVVASGAALCQLGLGWTANVVITAGLGLLVSAVALVASSGHGERVWTQPAMAYALAAAVAAPTGASVTAQQRLDRFAWSAGAAAAAACVLTLWALRSRGPLRTALQVVDGVAVAATWVLLLAALDMSASSSVAWTGVVAGAAAAVCSIALRWWHLDRDWFAVSLSVASAGICGSAASAGSVELRPAIAGIGVGFVGGAVAAGVLATPMDWWPLRHLSAALLLGSLGAFLAQADAVDADVVLAMTVTGGLGISAALAWWSAHRESQWAPPALLFSGMASVASMIAAVAAWPRHELLIPVLAVAALEAAAVGLLQDRLVVVVASPVLLCVAWFLFAQRSLTSDPQWYTVPIGVAILADVGLVRRGAEPVKGSQLAAALGVTEYVGMAFVVGAAVARALTGEVWMGVLAVAFGAALAAWGAVTKVRRRAFSGAGTVVVSLVLMIVVPLGRYLGQQPHVLEGASLWLVVAALGLVALLVAAFLERGRARVRQLVQRINDLTTDWE